MKVKFRETGEEVVVYGVHKSGPANDGTQTKFLVCALGEWGWMPCNDFVASLVNVEEPLPLTHK